MAVTSWGARDYEELSWKFLHSEFARGTYANWPIERRLDAYLRHHDLLGLRNGGSAYRRLLDSVMENIGPAHRRGILGLGASQANQDTRAAR
ncbi:MAG: hypothetical protein K0U76_03910 [Actinomycetia bacterium]|nr:hypothetical protein [Actinomycetes bacterium]MCH9700525.1 hypothetical protein [Actinomycetes bacterium]MCH9760745.1 hypothetical protein [Actinomycetes bacterium]